jgi:branched-chain amino acid transport system permease protein
MTGTAARRLAEWAPGLLLPALAVLALPLMAFPAWVTLTAAGLAMGMMLFLMAAGLTLIFGLMDVLNFAHAGFVTLGAYLTVSVFGALSPLVGADGLALNLLALAAALLAAAALGGAFGAAFEHVIIRRVYGSHLQQILITVGGLIVAEQLIVVIWGAEPLHVAKPESLRGSLILGGAAIERFRLVTVALGLVVYLAMHLVLNRTRIGLLVRASVENRGMVEALGFRVRRLFVGVFIAGTALAGLGGVMWAVYQELVSITIGAEMTILMFIVVIIGGLGSVGGCFMGAMLVGLTANYTGFLAPKLALGSNIALMVLILLWRPRGLFPVAKL